MYSRPVHDPRSVGRAGNAHAAAGMTTERLDRRLKYLHSLTGMSPSGLARAPKVEDYLHTIDAARAMMDSPVKGASTIRSKSRPRRSPPMSPKSRLTS